MSFIIFVSRNNAIGKDVTGGVNVEELVLLKELVIHKIVEIGEHGIVQHMVSVQHRHRVTEVLMIQSLGVDAALKFILLLHIAVHVVVVILVCRGLEYREVNSCIRDIDPCVNILVQIL